MRYNIRMKEGRMGVIRYELEYNDDPAYVKEPMFRQVLRYGKEAYFLPLPKVKDRVHDRIASAADIEVVKACVFYRLKEKGVPPNKDRIKKCQEHYLEVIRHHQFDAETTDQTVIRLTQQMDDVRTQAGRDAKVARFAYKFGMAEAYLALKGQLTGKGIPPLLSLNEYSDLSENEAKIMRISGLYTQWEGLAALPDSNFDSKNNPFKDPLLMIQYRTDSIISI